MATLALLVPMRLSEKHASNPVAKKQRFLNFGALALASYCAQNGHQAVVIDEYTFEGRNPRSEMSSNFGDEGPDVIGVSCISAYSVERAKQLIAELNLVYPKSILMIGGQHFAGFWKDRFSTLLPGSSVLVAGEAEKAVVTILDLLDGGRKPDDWSPSQLPENVWWQSGGTVINGNTPSSVVFMDEIVVVNYDLYPGSPSFFPSIEFSRGCPHACVFCANTRENARNFRSVSFSVLRVAIDELSRKFGRNPVNFYMQASDFILRSGQIDSFLVQFRKLHCQPVWRTEIRVDEMHPSTLEVLRSCGLSYLDIGLESASLDTLRNMRKTTNPKAYLKKAGELLEAAKGLGIFTKVNYLIHPGDTPETVRESESWLLSRKAMIDGVSSGVTIEYPGTPLSTLLDEFNGRFGTQRYPHELSDWGVFNLHPSSALSYQQAEELALNITQKMQSRNSFIQTKSFGYLGAEEQSDGILRDIPKAGDSTPYG